MHADRRGGDRGATVVNGRGRGECRCSSILNILSSADERATTPNGIWRHRVDGGDHHTDVEEAMETLRAETVERINECTRETERAREEASTARSSGHSVGSWIVCVLSRRAQERTIEVHKNTLEELRRRDTESRSVTDTLRTEHTELRVREEMATNENRTLKRRMDELLAETEEAKRMRTTILTERAREEAERESLRTQASSLRAELDAVRLQRGPGESDGRAERDVEAGVVPPLPVVERKGGVR